MIRIHPDAVSSGQISSKLWLCEELERLNLSEPRVIWLLGGWYGMAGFLLLSRARMNIRCIRSFDIDPEATRTADLLNENWVWKDWQFKAFTRDANALSYSGEEYGEAPDILVNTSTEHFGSREWFANIPSGKIVALQSTDMAHEDHFWGKGGLDELREMFPLRESLYEGSLKFEYPDRQFSRFMRIGMK